MKRLDDTIRGVLLGAGVPDATALADVTRAWPAAVGDAIARAAWPQRIARDGTLHVTTVSSAWAFELGLLADDVLKKLAAALGGATPAAVRFAPGPVPAPPTPVVEHVPSPACADEPTRRLAEKLTAAMSDDELRETIARAAAASLARAASNRGF